MISAGPPLSVATTGTPAARSSAPLTRPIPAPTRSVAARITAAGTSDLPVAEEAAVTADWQGDPAGSDVALHTPAGDLGIRLPLPGRHNVMNALAASAAALAAGAGLECVGRGLESLAPVATAIEVSRGTLRVVRQNLAWAIGYNSLALPLAALGYVPPWAAAIGMSASSLIVVLNALRINRFGAS